MKYVISACLCGMPTRYDGVSKPVDPAIQALIDSMDIDIEHLEESVLDEASGFGREFAFSGGLSAAVTQVLKEMAEADGPESDAAKFVLKAVSCDGIDQ